MSWDNFELSGGKTPATARESNTPCILWDFYDAHDLWHICSSFALFFGALTLLTVDDDLVDTPRSQIRVLDAE